MSQKHDKLKALTTLDILSLMSSCFDSLIRLPVQRK